jgi:glycine cleavage system aminomethyltransferase T/glycine/D-amino acid oxidase-like deaminating enzyme
MQQHARVVIVGAGIVGCSVAYHLTKLGWRDIVVVEQGPLFETGGSTSHAPGLVFQINPSKTMTGFAKYTTELFRSLELDGEACGRAVGSLEVAWTPERLIDLRRKIGTGIAYGVEAHLLDSREARGRVPMLSEKILGAMYTPTDVHTRAVRPAEAMARAAEAAGASFHANTKVTGFEISHGRVDGVVTSRGTVNCDLVVAATGIWAPKVGRMAGVPIPLSPMQHLYARTKPLPELAGRTEEITEPFVRHQDRAMYFRQHGEAYGIGSYLHEPLLVESEDILDHEDAPVSPAEMAFTPRHFEQALAAAGDVMPALKAAGLDHSFNGMFSFTTDGFPVLGESPQVKGFWSAQAVWITHSGGVGKAVAEWIVDGRPGVDLRESDIARFHPHASSREYVRARSAQQYREVYDIIHPLQQPSKARGLRVSPYWLRQKELGAVFFESAGWERPQWFEANGSLVEDIAGPGGTRSGWEARQWSPIVAAEHRATRERVALFDLTPFMKLEVTGPGAVALMQRLTANNVDRPPGRVTYTAMLDHRGGIKCDLTVTRLAKDRFLVVTGGAMGLHDLGWMRQNMPDDGSVVISDVSAGQCCIGMWGPRARELMTLVCDDDVSNEGFPYLAARSVTVGEVPALATRISYAGELGWELYAPTELGLKLWDTLWEAGRPLGVAAAGGGAFDSLRLEKGYRLWGQDIHTEYNPYEAGIGFAVRLRKGGFIGREALVRARSEGIKRKLCCMTLDDPDAVVLGKEPILRGDDVLGYVTSASYGYTIGRCIVYGYLPVEHSEPATRVDVLYFGERRPATVAVEPLYDPAMERLKS